MIKSIARYLERKVLAPVIKHLARRIGTGMAYGVPFIAVYLVISWIIHHADSLFKPILTVTPFVGGISGTGFAMLLTIFYLIGIIAKFIPGRKILALIQKVATKIPLVKSIYTPAKDITSFLGENSLGESRVVGTYLYNSPTFAYGLYASLVMEEGERFVNFLHLTSPAPPTLGAIFLVPEKNVYEIIVVSEDGKDTHPMAASELLKLILSGGISSPKNILRRPLAQK